ncbi:Nucleotidyltransferase domain protein [uncultured archaeon]|nr:Nucleotidyltransferase domain protein [uncultured archaeon]
MSDQMQSVREKIIDILRRNDVRRASFFGSIVRGEMTEQSDVDLLVEIELEDALGRKVDVVTYRSLHPLLRERILTEQVPIL